MAIYTRKEFLGLSALLAGTGCVAGSRSEAQETGSSGGQPPDP